MSLKLMLKEAAERYGEKVAIVSGERRFSYADLDEASNKVANAFIKIGVNKGDRVAMLLSNSPEFVITYFGIVKAGAIAVPLDTKYKFEELDSIFGDALPKVLVTESPTLEPLIPVLPKFQSIRHVIDLSSKCGGECLSFQEIMATGSAQGVNVEPEPEDIAQIAYTSGPSLYPRGVMLSHRCLVKEAAISGDGFRQTDRDIVPLFALPMYHAVGFVVVLLSSICKGSTLVMIPGLSIPTLLETIEKESGTILIGVPFIFALMVRMAEEYGVKHDLSSLRLCAGGGAPLTIDTSVRFKQHFGLDIAQFWGLTETTAHVTCQPIDGSGRPGSIGKALSGCEVKVVDENGRGLPANQTGELIVRGPVVMKGYYKNPCATAGIIKNDWLYTGDIGKVDGDGNLFIVGRKKDIIIVKGQNISPGDIEGVLCRHSKVSEAAVIGIPDEMRGEVVGAVISPKIGEVISEHEIKAFCLERIANYKVPKQVFFLDSLPKTATGNIDKEYIRTRLSIPPVFPKVAIP